MKRIMFFATPEDATPLLARFEAKTPLKFVEMGQRTTPNRAIYLASEEIPEPGIATHETASASQAYMVSHRDTKNHMMVRTLTNGNRVWNLFGVDNEEAVILSLGGLWRTGTLLPGIMNTMHAHPVGQGLMRAFASALRKEGFVKVETFWVGRGAMVLWRAGRRLTKTAEQSPPSMDLHLPEDPGPT